MEQLTQIEPWNALWADLSQGMANSQIEPWNNLWADLSQGMANSQMEPYVEGRSTGVHAGYVSE